MEVAPPPEMPHTFIGLVVSIALIVPLRGPHAVRLAHGPRRYSAATFTESLLRCEPLHMAVNEQIIPTVRMPRQFGWVISRAIILAVMIWWTGAKGVPASRRIRAAAVRVGYKIVVIGQVGAFGDHDRAGRSTLPPPPPPKKGSSSRAIL
jgi:hypothetical protein